MNRLSVVGQEVSPCGSEEGREGAEEEGASCVLCEEPSVDWSGVCCSPHRTDSGSGVGDSFSHRHSRVA